MRTDDEIKEWLAIREREALKDADTAEVTWSYCYFPDPYDIDEDVQEEGRVVGRVHVARRPKSHIWIPFYDLPDAISGKLLERHRSKLEFSTRWWFEHRQIASCTGGGRAFRRWLLWSRHSRPCVALGSRLRRQWPPRPMTSRKSNRLSP
jgi:hypothetical protein